MVVNLLNNIKLSGHNNHLKDIFSENCYLELGNIHYQLLHRLLEYEEVDYKDVCSFDILNSGLGHSDLENEELKNQLPFYFFKNINTKNKSMQIFLTYGLFSYSSNNVEKFAPIILIPVNMFLKEGTIIFQMISKPIENRTLLDEVNINNRMFNSFVKLDSLINIDRYVLGFENIDGCHVSFESFLTFAKVRTCNLHLDHKAFSFRKDSSIEFKTMKGVINNSEIFGVDVLSKLQRQALLSSRNENSFAISGRVGTGKTTTLLNIALDRMASGKKVLYVSNILETKNEIINKLKLLNLDSFFLDLTIPNNSLPQFVYSSLKAEEDSVEDVSQSIMDKYNAILNYENILFGRICDFRYNEILSELAILSTKDITKHTFDDLTVIYKHEYEDIIKSIKVISDKAKKLNMLDVKSIVTSLFSEIPTNLDSSLLNYDEIMKVLTTIRDLFSELLLKKQLLEKKYGFNSIASFGRLGFIRIYIDGLHIEDIPESWIEVTGEVFNKAQNKFYDLERDMAILQDMYSDLNCNYKDLDNIDIDYEISQTLGDIYNVSDYEKIDLINQKRQEINKLINRGGIEKETFLNMSKKIRSFMKLNVNDEIKNINEVVKFADFICENRVDPVWIKYLNEDFLLRSIPKINESKKYIEEFNVIYKRFEKKMPKYPLNDVPNLLNQLIAYENEPSSRRKKEYAFIHAYRKKNNLLNLKEEISITEDLCEYLKDINVHTSRYEKLVGHKYILGDDAVNGINKLCDYIKTIKSSEIKKKVIEFIGSVEWDFKLDENASNHVVFNLYRNSYRNIIEIYEELHKYLPLKKQSKMMPILNDMMSAFEYFRQVFNSNDRMMNVILDYSNTYATFEEYIKLKTKLQDLYNHRQMLKNNVEYKELYGKYYLDVYTNCGDIRKILDFYNYYQQIFKTYELCVKSLSEKRRSEIQEIFFEIRNIFELMGLNITNYNTVFKNSFTISYYNNSFSEVIKYLNKLIDAKEELHLYLDIIDSVQVVMKYKLFRWVNYLVNSESLDNVVDEFKLSYFQSVSDAYLKIHQIMPTSEVMLNLEMVSQELKTMTKISKKELQSQIKRHALYRASAKFNGNYDDYLDKVTGVKKLCFADTTTLNNYISINQFDTVLIDDVQSGSSSEYGIAFKANQVILAGVEQLQTLFSNDVISRMRKSNVLSFKQRYYPTPKHLVNNMDGASSVVKKTKQENVGVEILKYDPPLFVLSLLKENHNYKINVYCSSLTTKRNFYETFAKISLSEDVSYNEILSFLTNNINVCDVCEEYLIDSDYNILYLDEYSGIKFDNNATNMFDFILQTKKKLFIYDPNDLLDATSEISSIFISKIKLLVETSNDIFNKLSNDNLLVQIAKVFKSHKIKVYDHHDELDLVLEYKNQLYGVMVYFNHDISSLETVTNYLECQKIYSKNGMKIYSLMLYDLSKSLNKQVELICEDIIHGQEK